MISPWAIFPLKTGLLTQFLLVGPHLLFRHNMSEEDFPLSPCPGRNLGNSPLSSSPLDFLRCRNANLNIYPPGLCLL